MHMHVSTELFIFSPYKSDIHLESMFQRRFIEYLGNSRFSYRKKSSILFLSNVKNLKYICTALYMFYKVVNLTFSGHFSDVILYEIQKYQLDYLYSVPRDPRFTFTFCLKGGMGHPSILRLFKEHYI